MRKTFSEGVESRRDKTDKMFGTVLGERFGLFLLTSPETGQVLTVLVCSAEKYMSEGESGEPWDHVSVSLRDRVPTWGEMCFVKRCFFEDDECVVQFHPAKSDYVNLNPYVLHLWKPSVSVIPMPPIKCV